VLLIRPLLRANEARQARAHLVIFFIFMVFELRWPVDAARRSAAVSRVLNGVPFQWTLRSCRSG